MITALKATSSEEEAILAETQREPRFEVKSLAFSPDSATLAVGTSIGQVKLFDARNGNLARALDDAQGKKADGQTADKYMPLRARLAAPCWPFPRTAACWPVGGRPFAAVSLLRTASGRAG